MFQECYYRESTKKERFHVIIPRSEVPNWFRHQSVGASINLEVPSYLFRGIVLCAVFGLHQHRPPNHLSYDLHLTCHFKVNGDDLGSYPFTFVSGEFEHTVESDHCWFVYLLPYYLREEFPQIVDGSSYQLEIEFQYLDTRIKIKKC